MRCLALLLLVACYNVGEYTLPDGGLAPHPGDDCPCSMAGDRITDVDTGRIVETCMSTDPCGDGHPLIDGGSCPVSVCFGPSCCVWRAP